MKLDEFILVCDIQRILDTLETENVCLTMNPLLDEGHVKKLFITCQNRESSYTCSRDFDVENLLCEEDHETYFAERIGFLIHKCERHMEA